MTPIFAVLLNSVVSVAGAEEAHDVGNAAQKIAQLNPAPVLTQVEGYARLVAPLESGRALKGTMALVEGKMVEVYDARPGMEIPNGATLQTFFSGKAKVVLPNGDAFYAANATEMAMKWKSQLNGKFAMDIDLKEGLMRGIVKKSDELSINVVTNKFKAAVTDAEFVTAKLVNTDPKEAVEGAVIKVIHGSTQLAAFDGLQKKLVDVKAGTDLVMGLKKADMVPLLQEEVLKQATSLDPARLLPVPPSLAGVVSSLSKGADGVEDAIDKMLGPEPDNCGCPSIAERLKRAALKTAKKFVHNVRGKVEKTVASAVTDKAKAAGPEEPANSAQPAEKQEVAETPAIPTTADAAVEQLTSAQELACMSPVLAQLQGVAQIVNVLKDGIFSSKEAKPGDCVANNSIFKNFADAKSMLKFPNGDELLSGDNVNMALKWTQNKLNVNLNEGTIHGVFNEVSGRVVNLQSAGINAIAKAGDFALTAPKLPSAPSMPTIPSLTASTDALKSAASTAAAGAVAAGAAAATTETDKAKSSANNAANGAVNKANTLAGAASAGAGLVATGASAQLAGNMAAANALANAAPGVAAGAAGVAAGAAASAAGSLLGATLSIFDGAAKVGGKAVSAGSKIVAGSSNPTQLASDEIQKVKAQTTPMKSLAEEGAKTVARAPANTADLAQTFKTQQTQSLNGAARALPSHPAPRLDTLKINESEPEEALFRRYLDPK